MSVPRTVLTLSSLHPFGTSATLARLSLLGFSSFLFHFNTVRGFHLKLYFSTPHPACVCVRTRVCLRLHGVRQLLTFVR